MLVESSRVRYEVVVQLKGPGIAKAERRRQSAFTTLLDQVLDDEAALDALVFAYEELDASERTGLLLAVVQDAKQPLEPLAAFLSVERDPRLRRRIETLIGRHTKVARAAFLWGDAECGGAALQQAVEGAQPEALILAWDQNELESLSIETRTDLSFFGAGDTVPVEEVVELVLPMLWRYIRSGRELPEGIDRFAGLLSVGRPR
jgi:hypothetical protein